MKARRKKKKAIPYLIQYSIEREAKESVKQIPFGVNLRGIYALFKKRGENYDVVYIGMSTKDLRGRLLSHVNNKKWTHFSMFKVWPNITDEEIQELEGLFLHIYSKDSRALIANELRSKKILRKIRVADLCQHRNTLKNFECALRAFPDFKKMNIYFSVKDR